MSLKRIPGSRKKQPYFKNKSADPQLETFHLMVFFTFGNALSDWHNTGLIGRELLLYKKMVQQGHQVTLFTYGDENDYTYKAQLEGINIIPVYTIFRKSNNKWINFFKSFLIPFNRRFKKKFTSVDILKTNQMFGAWLPLIISLIYKKTFVVRCGYEMLRNSLRNERHLLLWLMKAFIGYALELLAYIGADSIVVSNLADKEFIKRRFPVKSEKLVLIRNYIDTDLFKVDRGISLKSGKGRDLLYIGRLRKEKNVENLVRSAGETGCNLNIVGQGENKTYLINLAELKNIHVTFAGVVDNRELPEIIAQYNIVVQPSLYEGNPKALLEAMSCARIVIGTDVEGIRELIADRENGFLCGTDVQSISQAIQTVWGTSEARLNQIAAKAREFIVKECSVGQVFKQEMKLYATLLS